MKTLCSFTVLVFSYAAAAVAQSPEPASFRTAQSDIENCQAVYRDRAKSSAYTREERAQFAHQYKACLEERQARNALTAQERASAVPPLYALAMLEANTLISTSDANKDFLGMSWGVGVGFSRARSEAIESAAIVNNVVTVTSDARMKARVFLETHYYFDGICGKRDDPIVKRGCGPFMAVATSGNDVLGAGFGWMFGWKPQTTNGQGFSLGLGAILDNKVKNLASGFTPGSPPPAGATTVLTEEKARWSNILFVTRTF